MLLHYMRVAGRSLGRNKIHSFINIFGLTLGIACCILIALYVHDEFTFDRFHSKAEHIYRVYGKENWGEGQEFFYTVTQFPLGPALKEGVGEIEAMCRITPVSSHVKIGADIYDQSLVVTNADFFKIFDFSFLSGEGPSSLEGMNNVLITERAATKYFGQVDPVGKMLSVRIADQYEDFHVKGLIKDPPANSSINFEMIIGDLNLPKFFGERSLNSGWFTITPETYVMLREGVKPGDVTSKFPGVLKNKMGDDSYKKSHIAVGLQPLTSIHLDNSFPAGIAPLGNIKYAYILSAVAFLLLFIACINFITLSIGRSIRRAKEVGVRKVAGAARKQLVFQFIGEALLVTAASLLFGLGLAQLSLPLFNELSGKLLTLTFNLFTVGISVSLLFIIGILSGSYPAFILSGFKPVAILKGSITGLNSRQGLRKALVGMQLVLSIFLVSSTIIMRDQLRYLQNKDLGFNKEQLMVIPLTLPSTGKFVDRLATTFDQAKILKNELTAIKGVSGTSTAVHDFGNGQWATIGYTDDNGVYRTFHMNVVDAAFVDLLKIRIKNGRAFNENNSADEHSAIIVNEAFVKEMGWSDAIGKRIPGKNFVDHSIIGVMEDFHYSSLHTSVEPLVMAMDAAIIFSGSENVNFDASPSPRLLVRLLPGEIQTSIEEIKKVWTNFSSGEEFAFWFADQRLNDQYQADQNLGKIIGYATLIAIVIGSLGLYGLASIAMQNRRKEISIRKVLGASETRLMANLSKEYIVLVVIALGISVPITWYLMSQWLTDFEYHVGVTPWVFLLSGGISLFVALLTIGWQTFKTAFEKPAETLKYE
jgi:putative ABC transport system permease protein